MRQGLTGTQLAALTTEHVNMALLVELQFASGILYFTDLPFDYTWGGFTWRGVGSLGEVSALEEAEDGSILALRMNLTGLLPGIFGIAFTPQEYKRRLCIVRVVFFGVGVGRLNEPVAEWAGLMDVLTPSINGPEFGATLTVESELAELQRARQRRNNNEDQQVRHPGDTFYKPLDNNRGKTFAWPTAALQRYFAGG